MQRSSVVTGLLAAALAVSVAQAEDTPAPAPPPQTALPQDAPPQNALPQDAPPQNAAPQNALPQNAPPQNALPQTAPPQTAVQSVAPEDAEAILGQRVTDAEGKEIGRLVDVLVDVNGQPQAAVIDFGGFMGVGNRKIAVHWSALRFSPSDPKRKVAVEMTPDQIKAAPEFRDPSKAASVVTPAEATPQPPSPSSP
jgi:hypothetical protein